MQKLNIRNFKGKMVALVIILLFVVMLASCDNKLSGTYSASGGSVTFSGSQVTLNFFMIVATGTYSIKDGEIYIVWNDDDYVDDVFDFEIIDSNTIIFDGIKMKKR